MALRLIHILSAFARIVRWQNLIMVAVCLWVFHLVLTPYIRLDEHLLLSGIYFTVFVGSTMCVTAYGYLINDAFDLETDAINKPLLRIDYQDIAPIYSMHLIWAFWLTGGCLALWLAWQLQQWLWLPLYPLVTGSLYLYARTLKGAGWMGNLLVALLSSSLHWVLLIPDWPWLQSLPSTSRQEILQIFIGFSVLAFGISMFREIVKDMEDQQGDKQTDWQTGVVRYGLEVARKLASGIAIMTGISLLWAILFISEDWLSPFILLIALVILIRLIWHLQTARQKHDFHQISRGAKWVLLIGLLAILSL
ncbi:MAG: UbiA family prenyltransferase [Saprospiraceae bacterium]|nr:UbiA family prenyltransferase [Saprospiraceae bacterium]